MFLELFANRQVMNLAITMLCKETSFSCMYPFRGTEKIREDLLKKEGNKDRLR